MADSVPPRRRLTKPPTTILTTTSTMPIPSIHGEICGALVLFSGCRSDLVFLQTFSLVLMVGMAGKEDASTGGADGSQEPSQLAHGRRMYWRSASWSSSRTSLPPLNPDMEKDGLDPNGGNSSHGRRPLTPRSQQSFKARSCLPPLQPLAIARRSLDEWTRARSDDIGEWPLPSTPSGR